MSESKRPVFASIAALAIVGVCFWAFRGTPDQRQGDQVGVSIGPGGELSELSELQLRNELEQALTRYHREKTASLQRRCESLFKAILALPEPSPRTYSLCATTSIVLGQPRKAIEIVEKAMAEDPNGYAGGLKLPQSISGRFRIAAIATQLHDFKMAVRVYREILERLEELEKPEIYEFLCHMHLADLFGQMRGKKSNVVEELEKALEVVEGIDRDSQSQNDQRATDSMRGWALYRLDKCGHSHGDPNSSADPRNGVFFLATGGALLSCPSQFELEQAAESDYAPSMRDLARIALAIMYMHGFDFHVAEECLAPLAKGHSYFRGYAEFTTDVVRGNIQKIEEKIRMLVEDLKSGDQEKRERAASKLAYECGSKGIKVLQRAQDDPNKYVRYVSACTLARQSVDRSVKVRFDTVFGAFADADPRVRSKARSAVGFRSLIEIGPKEIVALIQLMKEHYSEELAGTLESLLFEERRKPEIMNMAMPELVSLIDCDSPEVTEGILDIFERIGPPSKAAPALARCLDKAEDEALQRKIIGTLDRIGPAARDAVPVLKRYAGHDNPEIRNAALNALRRIAPSALNQLKSVDNP